MQGVEQHGIHELHWEITGRCNLNCVYCYNAGIRKGEEMSLEEMQRMIADTKSHGTRLYTLTGGEPTSSKKLWKILKMLDGEKVAILTNAKLLDKAMIKRFKQYPQVFEFKISLDGFRSHDRLRRGSNYRDVLKTIRMLKEEGYRVVINTIVLHENERDLYKLYKILLRLQVDRWRVDMPFRLGNYVRNIRRYSPPDPGIYTKMFAKIICEHEQSRNRMVFEIFNLYKSQFRPLRTIVWDADTHPCEYKRQLLSMKPNGDIIFCPSLTFAMSNYRRAGSITNVFAEEARHPFYDVRVGDLHECAGCRYLKICGGGCRANAIYDFDDWNRRDAAACYTFPFWEQEILPVLKVSHQRFFRRLIDKQGFDPQTRFQLPNGKKARGDVP